MRLMDRIYRDIATQPPLMEMVRGLLPKKKAVEAYVPYVPPSVQDNPLQHEVEELRSRLERLEHVPVSQAATNNFSALRNSNTFQQGIQNVRMEASGLESNHCPYGHMRSSFPCQYCGSTDECRRKRK